MSNNFASRHFGATRRALNVANETIERLTKERDEARNEAHRWSKEALNQVGEAKAERGALKAEVERLKGEISEASGQVEWLDKSNSLLRTQIEGFK